jgi:cytidine deaminase
MISDETIDRLKSAARAASEHAYCPYSKFRVGAAVLTDSGEIFAGCNVENASYGLTICAERNAVFQMVANASAVLRMIVVYTPTAAPTAPCGACRQVINEFGPADQVRILSFCDGPEILDARLSDLLPAAFGPHCLE